MIRWLFFLFVFGTASTLAGQPVKWLAGKSFDFGEIIQDQPVQTTFAFKNTLTTPITIETVRTTCGCTAVKWPEEPILPDDEATIIIQFDSRKIGFFKKRIRLFFVDVRKSERLTITGEVIPR